MLIIEEIHDVFNLGRILQCTDAFGVKKMLCIAQDPTVRMYVQSSIGRICHVNLSVTESAAVAISYCRRHGVRIIATTPHCNEGLIGFNFSGPCAVAMGNEAAGLSRELLAGADSYMRIEMFGMTDSLNVAVATGIILHAMVTR